MEECGELIQALSKIMRFGHNPENVANLEQELGDVAAMLHLFVKYGWVTQNTLDANINAKLDKLVKYSILPIEPSDYK